MKRDYVMIFIINNSDFYELHSLYRTIPVIRWHSLIWELWANITWVLGFRLSAFDSVLVATNAACSLCNGTFTFRVTPGLNCFLSHELSFLGRIMFEIEIN